MADGSLGSDGGTLTQRWGSKKRGGRAEGWDSGEGGWVQRAQGLAAGSRGAGLCDALMLQHCNACG